jgi:hypothetical protein
LLLAPQADQAVTDGRVVPPAREAVGGTMAGQPLRVIHAIPSVTSQPTRREVAVSSGIRVLLSVL